MRNFEPLVLDSNDSNTRIQIVNTTQSITLSGPVKDGRLATTKLFFSSSMNPTKPDTYDVVDDFGNVYRGGSGHA